ncbi:hypothetical protein BS586_22495, partial [Vibrio parahaemolyticus]
SSIELRNKAPEMVPVFLAGGVLSPPSPPPHALNNSEVAMRPNVDFSVFLVNIIIWQSIFLPRLYYCVEFSQRDEITIE